VDRYLAPLGDTVLPVKWVPALVFVALGSSAGCAHNSIIFPDRGWSEQETEHFRVHTTEPDKTQELIAVLEGGHAILRAGLFPAGDLPPSLNQIDVLYAGSESYPEFSDLFGLIRSVAAVPEIVGSPIGAGGVLVVGDGPLPPTRDAEWVAEPGRKVSSLPKASHGLTHLFVHAAGPHAPIWIHEGLAGLLDFIGAVGDRDVQVMTGLDSVGAAPVTMAQLVASTSADFDTGYPASYMRTSICVMAWLRGPEKRLPPDLPDLIGRLGVGLSFEKALEMTYPGATMALADRWIQQKCRAADAFDPFTELTSWRIAIGPRDTSIHRQSPVAPEKMAALFKALRLAADRYGRLDWFGP